MALREVQTIIRQPFVSPLKTLYRFHLLADQAFPEQSEGGHGILKAFTMMLQSQSTRLAAE